MLNPTRVGVSLLTCNLSEHPTHLRATEYALRSLFDSDLVDFDWQLQVLDNASTCQKTLDLLRQTATLPRVDVVFSTVNRGIAGGRNLCYQALVQRNAPEFVIEIHTDHVFPKRWLGPLIRRMQTPGYERAGVVGSSLLTGGGEWRSPKFMTTYDSTYEKFMHSLESSVELWRRNGKALPGLSHPAVFRWGMIEELGERDDAGMLCVYDPRMPGLQNFEDTELAYRAHSAGWQVLIDFSSVVYHHYHLSRLSGVLWEVHGHGYNVNNVYVQEKHGEAYLRFQGELGRWIETAYAR